MCKNVRLTVTHKNFVFCNCVKMQHKMKLLNIYHISQQNYTFAVWGIWEHEKCMCKNVGLTVTHKKCVFCVCSINEIIKYLSYFPNKITHLQFGEFGNTKSVCAKMWA